MTVFDRVNAEARKAGYSTKHGQWKRDGELCWDETDTDEAFEQLLDEWYAANPPVEYISENRQRGEHVEPYARWGRDTTIQDDLYVMKVIRHMTYKAIAAETGLSIGTIKSAVHREKVKRGD